MDGQEPKPDRRPRRRPPARVFATKNPFGEGNPRAVAYDLATRAVRPGEAYDQIWDSDPGLLSLSQRDRALAIHLSAGVLRSLRRLDRQARELTDGKSDDLPLPVRWILRLGLFQVVECDRIPPHAAVSTAVDAAKVVAHQGIAGLVNAVLRRAVRERQDRGRTGIESIFHSTTEDTPLSELGDRLSMPEWLVELLIERYGQKAISRIERWANTPPSYYFRLAQNGPGLSRLQELMEEHELGHVRVHPDFPEYAALGTAALSSGSPLFAEPLGWVQNPAAGLVVRLLDPQPGDTVIDLFAAPGGKSMAIAEAVGPSGQVLAVDRNEKRLERVTENKLRLGFEQILPMVGDAERLGPRTASHILADVPCSSLGTLPKNPEVRWTKNPADIERISRSQRIWLTAASAHVAPGGVLVYATCTITPQENEAVVESFLKNMPAFTLESAAAWVDARYVDAAGYLRTVPPEDGLDGVFAARLRRADS